MPLGQMTMSWSAHTPVALVGDVSSISGMCPWCTVTASPSHRANILDPRFSQAGIGVVHAAGRVWVTMDLIAY